VLLVDDLLLLPVRSVFWIVREIHNAAQEELATESENISAELSDLYMSLETGRITEQEFEQGEKVLLERLEKVQRRSADREAGGDEAETKAEEQYLNLQKEKVA
jgi:hypothetical protein